MVETRYTVLLAVVTLVVCEALNKSKSAVEIITQTKSFPNQSLIYDWQSYEDKRVVYLVCDKDTHSKCQIRQEAYPYENVTHCCNVTFDVSDTSHYYPHVLVTPFGENRAILLWEDIEEQEGNETNVRISVVHLKECRQTADFILHGKSDLVFHLQDTSKIVTYNSTFDIFFKDSERCGDRECKLTINDEGKAIEGPVKFMNNNGSYLRNVHSVAGQSSAKGYVYTKYDPGTEVNSVFLVQPDGKTKRLESTGEWFKLSVVHETIGVCSKAKLYSHNITCSQYNADGELKLYVSYQPIVRPYTNILDIDSHFESIYTLPEEGFLLQFFEFVNCQNFKDCEYPSTMGYYMVKLDTTGKEVGKFYFKGYDYHHGISEIRHFWENQDKKGYCIVLSNDDHIDKFDLTATCFTDAIFSTNNY